MWAARAESGPYPEYHGPETLATSIRGGSMSIRGALAIVVGLTECQEAEGRRHSPAYGCHRWRQTWRTGGCRVTPKSLSQHDSGDLLWWSDPHT